ncbi:MAG: membrane protein [Bdellovibrio sp. ArHS]|uniref:DUF924 family protein n=1 Tax=Bdellovibrio sp. ArHS TaxID=1569284 RepID=UPI000583A1D5|nr:DUF924 family protein [Bdellovibrio sp. ArHS]KHD88626.1 MAG: membrane protein [Bdellovibrio sp. ArHS]
MTYQDIIDFWFEEIDPSLWFMKDDLFDQQIRRRFLDVFEDVIAGKMFSWRKSPEGRLAEVIVLDQFSRNLFRDSAQAFAQDDLALHLAKEAVRVGDDQRVPVVQRHFFYMPYMHSEDLKVHDEAVRLFSQEGLENGLKFELLHKKIIETYGRYPHRNKALGRISTPAETEFLKQPGSAF